MPLLKASSAPQPAPGIYQDTQLRLPRDEQRFQLRIAFQSCGGEGVRYQPVPHNPKPSIFLFYYSYLICLQFLEGFRRSGTFRKIMLGAMWHG